MGQVLTLVRPGQQPLAGTNIVTPSEDVFVEVKKRTQGAMGWIARLLNDSPGYSFEVRQGKYRFEWYLEHPVEVARMIAWLRSNHRIRVRIAVEGVSDEEFGIAKEDLRWTK